jgi:hypothetical protein
MGEDHREDNATPAEDKGISIHRNIKPGKPDSNAGTITGASTTSVSTARATTNKWQRNKTPRTSERLYSK